jgi:hypothetical protein
MKAESVNAVLSLIFWLLAPGFWILNSILRNHSALLFVAETRAGVQNATTPSYRTRSIASVMRGIWIARPLAGKRACELRARAFVERGVLRNN